MPWNPVTICGNSSMRKIFGFITSVGRSTFLVFTSVHQKLCQVRKLQCCLHVSEILQIHILPSVRRASPRSHQSGSYGFHQPQLVESNVQILGAEKQGTGPTFCPSSYLFFGRGSFYFYFFNNYRFTRTAKKKYKEAVYILYSAPSPPYGSILSNDSTLAK